MELLNKLISNSSFNLVRPPYFLRKYFNELVWNIPTEEKTIYLTFDDGPIPEVTPWVLQTLERYNAQATFFCVGDNANRYPKLFEQLKNSNHTHANHTYNHLNGWKTNDKDYFKNISRANLTIQSKFFRPPYGRITPTQIHVIKKHYKIIMWDVLSKDYNTTLTGEQCFQNVILNAKPGSIVVFHDSIKAKERLQYALPKVLEHYSNLGYRFNAIPLHA
jgi:peptidoglycan/xylan/chitin deacetylase (PgdA/CDA1 family)